MAVTGLALCRNVVSSMNWPPPRNEYFQACGVLQRGKPSPEVESVDEGGSLPSRLPHGLANQLLSVVALRALPGPPRAGAFPSGNVVQREVVSSGSSRPCGKFRVSHVTLAVTSSIPASGPRSAVDILAAWFENPVSSHLPSPQHRPQPIIKRAASPASQARAPHYCQWCHCWGSTERGCRGGRHTQGTGPLCVALA